MINIIFGHTKHIRFSPIKHQFSYPIYMLELDINELDRLSKESLFFGYNCRRLLSISDDDYLGKGKSKLSKKVKLITSQFKLADSIHTVKMIAIPRFVMSTFRPISVYLLYADTGKLLGFFAEVTNIYKESSYYKLEHTQLETGSGRYTIDKDFHVSPFFDEVGQYSFKLTDNPKRFELHINYEKEDELFLYANFVGKKQPLNSLQIMRLVFIYPLTAVLIMPRILYQAFILYYFKKLPVKRKPAHNSIGKLRHMPGSILQRKMLDKVQSAFSDFGKGVLELKLPDNTTYHFGNLNADFKASIQLTNSLFFKTVRQAGEIGFGESYMNGEWESSDVVKVIEFMIMNKQAVDHKFRSTYFISMLNRARHNLKRNTPKNSKKNISEHYDLGNDFYKIFLDRTMMYSSGLFINKDDSLEQAQINKVTRLIEGLNLKSTDHVLEIGTGWGFVATTIAKKYGCKVTSVTLSKEQHDHAKQVAKEEGLASLVSIEMKDYRKIEGSFDTIISIEMIEAVGQEYLESYFDKCNQLLKPNGRFALQAITYPDNKYERYCKKTDFIRKHIFPGGHLPCLKIIDKLVSKNTQLKEIKRLNIAQGYAQTLALWRQEFIKQRTVLETMGFDEVFFRKWIYYFSSCEAAFKQDYIGCYQFHYEKKDL